MPTHFLFRNIFPKKKFWNTERSLYEKFRYYETKKVDGESWCAPTFFSWTFFDINFLKQRTVHLRNVWILWDKNFQRKIVKPFPLLCMKGFDCKTFETQKGSRTKFFGTVSQKTWRRSWCPPPLFTSTFFNIKNFLKHRKVPLRNVSLLGNKHFRSTVVIPRPFLSSTFSPSGKLSETQKIPWRTLLVLWNKIVLRRIVIPLPFLCMKNFDARFFWIEEVFPNEMFQNCETKKLTENRFLSKKNTFRSQKVFEAQ